MILSASRRTDIPAFYGDWFMRRINEGYFVKINPMNSKQKKIICLSPKTIDAIVFWTKNPEPFFQNLEKLDSLGYKYYFQFTLNNYPQVYEPNVPKAKKILNIFKQLSQKIGPEKVIWRYDPIILSNRTPISYHIDNFNYLSSQLKSYSYKCVISFLDYYGKVKKRLMKFEKKCNLKTYDICDKAYIDLLDKLLKSIKYIASVNGFELASCSETLDMSQYGIQPNQCIDCNLINDIFGKDIKYKKDTGQRKECLCAESVDIGMYNTCPHKCIYCYANYSDSTINKNLKEHALTSPVMVGNVNIDELNNNSIQLKLFK